MNCCWCARHGVAAIDCAAGTWFCPLLQVDDNASNRRAGSSLGYCVAASVAEARDVLGLDGVAPPDDG